MRLRFSRMADYGLRAALEVARAPAGELVTRHGIAASVNAPASVLAEALAALVRAGVLQAQAGPRGGYRLAGRANDVALYDVVTAIDDEAPPDRCVLHERVCSSEGPCPFHSVLVNAQQRFLDTLRTTTLADVLAGSASMTR